jgi:hypothetical protein
MPISTLNEVRETGNLPAKIDDKFLTPHHLAAARRLKRWVGEALYAAVAAEEESERRAAFIRAEAFLTLAEAMAALNLRMNASGGFEMTSHFAQSEGMAGTTRFMTPAEIEQAAAAFVTQARDAVADWLPAPKATILKVL